MTTLPELNDNFSKASLTSDYVFNWGIPNKVNIGLYFDIAAKVYTLMSDIKLENRKWWQSSKKEFIYSDSSFDNAITQANTLLNSYNYNIDYSHSKNFKDYIAFIESAKKI